jgi:hypothetical protein
MVISLSKIHLAIRYRVTQIMVMMSNLGRGGRGIEGPTLDEIWPKTVLISRGTPYKPAL